MVKKQSSICSQNKIFFICLILLLLFLVFYMTFYNNKQNIEFFDNLKNIKYYRCDSKKLGAITNSIFNDFDISKDNSNWNVYVPCGYNNVENELLQIQVNNKNKEGNKYIFGINGCDSIVSKNKIWESLVNCYGREKASTYMPESYVLHNKKDMKDFQKVFDPQHIYILKKNVQRKEGLKLTNNYNDISNAWKENYRVVQRYLTKLYLINKRKVNLRVYLLVVVDKGIVSFYVSNLGKCIYTKKEYNHNDFDFESNITSYHLDMTVYEKNPRDFIELFSYVDSQENNSKAGQKLSENILTLMSKISECLSKNIYQSSNIKNTVSFQLFGADVIFDDKLHTYLLELNKGPDMIPRDDVDKSMKKRVQEDMFRTVGLLPNNKKQNVFFEVYSSK